MLNLFTLIYIHGSLNYCFRTLNIIQFTLKFEILIVSKLNKNKNIRIKNKHVTTLFNYCPLYTICNCTTFLIHALNLNNDNDILNYL